MQETMVINGKKYIAISGDEVVRKAGEALVDEELTCGYTAKVIARMKELNELCPTRNLRPQGNYASKQIEIEPGME